MSLESILLSVLAMLVGLFVGLARRGRLRNLALVTFRWPWLLGVGVVLPVVVDLVDPPFATPAVVVALLALFVFTLANLRFVGMSVIAVGVLANLAPVLANGAMPVRGEALVRAGLADPGEIDRVVIRGPQRLERPGDRLTFLGDVVPVRETRQVMSFGDLVILVGITDVAANLLLRGRRSRRRMPDNAGAALLTIAPPAERSGAPPLIDIAMFERALSAAAPARRDTPERRAAPHVETIVLDNEPIEASPVRP